MSAPSARTLASWRIYWFGLAALWVVELAIGVLESDFTTAGDKLDIVEAMLLCLLLALSLLPMAGHFGYAWQRAIYRRWLWQVVFVVMASLQGIEIFAMIFLFGTFPNWILSVAYLPQIYALWACAHRSAHLWASVPSPPENRSFTTTA